MTSAGAYLILRDLWKDELKITNKANGVTVTVPIEGGFRGLYNLPLGEYTIENHGAELNVNLTEDAPIQVWQLDSTAGTWTETKQEDDDFGYHNLARSGAMNSKLLNAKQAVSSLFSDSP
ncbi:unnamed protein product [Adineta ricciae]|uniref:Uncharacterized protein n=1 Tax=Adineta ricciae TaxID=249248 RepID=A0A814VP19_ADIRI|nr:unnamed protein product [Adineta ricciae]CAF1191543.1 unnamed protein product [Adineta ricciae]